MRFGTTFSLLTLLFSLTTSMTARQVQQAAVLAQRDPAGLGILAHSLEVSGVQTDSSLAFTASGTITYFYGANEVTGAVTMKVRGKDQFKLEAQLADGLKRFIVNHDEGALSQPDGRLRNLPSYNAVPFPVLPHVIAVSTLGDPAISVVYDGRQEAKGRTFQVVHIQKSVERSRLQLCPDCPEDQLHCEIFFDSATGLVTKILDNVYPNYNPRQAIPREFSFEEYSRLAGIMTPALITETVAGGKIFQIRISTLSVSRDLPDAEFSIESQRFPAP